MFKLMNKKIFTIFVIKIFVLNCDIGFKSMIYTIAFSGTVNSENSRDGLFFWQNFAYAKFCENKTVAKSRNNSLDY